MTACQTFQAIETHYLGHRLRSRLEARWAVFFSEAGLQWEYEPEGFRLPGGVYYLPDFYIQDVDSGSGLFFEIKPYKTHLHPNGVRWPLLDPKVRAARDAGLPVVQLNGLLNPERDFVEPCGVANDAMYAFDHPFDDPYGWCVCPFSQKVGVAFDCRGARVSPKHPFNTNEPDPDHVDKWFLENGTSWSHGDKAYSGSHPKILDAFVKANRARFEHGEHG